MGIKVEDIEFVSSSRTPLDGVVACVIFYGRVLYFKLDPESFLVDPRSNNGISLEGEDIAALNFAICKYANDNDIEPRLSCSILERLVDELSEISGERYRLDDMWDGGFELRQWKKSAFWHVASYSSSRLAYCEIRAMLDELKQQI